MSKLPDDVCKAWDNHEGPVILTTVDEKNIPNAIYVTCVRKYGDDTLVIADNYFFKTRANILAGCQAALLFITKEGKSYQIKGKIDYFTDGPLFEDMKRWNSPQHPGHAAAALKVEQSYAGAKKLV